MRHALQDGALSAASFQSILDWDDVQLSDAIQRAQEAIQRADIQPAETWRAIRTLIGTTRFLQISLKQLNAEADLVSRSFATDGLFRLPHEKNQAPQQSTPSTPKMVDENQNRYINIKHSFRVTLQCVEYHRCFEILI
jgi:hypothetical protein